MKRSMLGVLCGSLVLLTACGEEGQKAAQSMSDAAKKAADSAASSATAAVDQATAKATEMASAAKDAAVTKATELFDAAKVKANDLITRVEALPEAARAPLAGAVESVKTQLGSAEKALSDLKGASGDWSGLSTTFTEIVGKLNTSISELASKLK